MGIGQEWVTLEFDGGSRGNPGPAGIGVVLRASDNTPLLTLGRFLGRATNNVAEYRALIAGLAEAKKLGVRRLKIRGDSELIIKQMRGEYRVKHPDLKGLYDEAQFLYHQFDEARIEHNLRHHNTLADRLANLAMDRKAEVTDAEDDAAAPAEADPPTPSSPQAGDRFVCGRCGAAVTIETPSPVRPHQLKPFVCQCGNRMTAVR